MISYQHLALEPHASLLSQLIACYRAVFSEEPWNEWKYCRRCRRKWGLSQWLEYDSTLDTCKHITEDFWPEKNVQEMLSNCFRVPGISFWIAYDDDRVVGFCYGIPLLLTEIDTIRLREHIFGM